LRIVSIYNLFTVPIVISNRHHTVSDVV